MRGFFGKCFAWQNAPQFDIASGQGTRARAFRFWTVCYVQKPASRSRGS
ncbi:hypothetical protein CSIRO_0672 [Bradyrhizobiaceae bacterium SG-6C]|nr:hypothetical protein CSIRO_0672 [Bradyrhizobiaceae bacterium SG-6C]